VPELGIERASGICEGETHMTISEELSEVKRWVLLSQGKGVVVVVPGARTQERDACIITLLAM